MAYLGENIPKLGFGLMRLPMIDKEIDIEQTKKMVDMFIERGFIYFDTAYGYYSGKSEAAAKVALVDRYPRESFLLATKLPAWGGANNAEEARQMFWTSLERTGAGYFDFYLLHNLGAERTKLFDDYGVWDFLREMRDKGLIRHLGFSFHDSADKLDEILTAHPDMEFVQLQINYADWESDSVQSRACYEVARKHGKPVVIMEPVKGGTLAKLPESIDGIFKAADPDASTASWAVRFAASLDGVITVLSGMSNLEQMDDNTSFMADFKPLSESEKETVAKVQKALADVPRIPCTACGYCMKGCPMGIKIPDILDAVNYRTVFGDETAAKSNYDWTVHNTPHASECIGCGQCESVCPQKISIIEELRKASEIFD